MHKFICSQQCSSRQTKEVVNKALRQERYIFSSEFQTYLTKKAVSLNVLLNTPAQKSWLSPMIGFHTWDRAEPCLVLTLGGGQGWAGGGVRGRWGGGVCRWRGGSGTRYRRRCSLHLRCGCHRHPADAAYQVCEPRHWMPSRQDGRMGEWVTVEVEECRRTD